MATLRIEPTPEQGIVHAGSSREEVRSGRDRQNVPPGMVDISCWPYLTMVAAMDFGQQMNTRLPMVSFFLHFRTCFIPEHSC